MYNLDAYKEYLQARGLSLNYLNAMRLFSNYIQDRELTQEEITKFFLQNEYGEQSRNLFIKAGRHFTLFAGVIDSEWHKIKLLKCARKIPHYLSEKDLGRAVSYLTTYHGKIITSIKAEAVLSILFYTGIRRGELLNLKREDFNFEERSLRVWGQKTKTERIVYFPEKLVKILTDYFESEKMDNNAFNLSIVDLRQIAQILSTHMNKKLTTHAWRHSSARYMIERGIPIGIVSKLLGHKSLQTTLIYTDPDEEQVKRIYQEKMK